MYSSTIEAYNSFWQKGRTESNVTADGSDPTCRSDYNVCTFQIKGNTTTSYKACLPANAECKRAFGSQRTNRATILQD